MVAARATTPARGGSHEGADRPAAHCGCSDRIARAEAEVAARGVAACWDQERDAEACAVGSGRHCARCSATHAACALCALRPRRAAGEIQWRQRFSIQVMWLLSRLGLDGSHPLRSAGGGLSSDRRAGRLQASARRHACSCRSTARRSSRGIRRHWVPLAAAFDSEAPADPPTRVGYQEIAQALEILRRLLQCCQDRRPFPQRSSPRPWRGTGERSQASLSATRPRWPQVLERADRLPRRRSTTLPTHLSVVRRVLR